MTQPDQMFLAAPSDVATYHLGSLLSGGDSDPKRSNSFADWREMIDGYHAEAQKSRLQIPLLYGVDAVHGHNNVVGAVVFPHEIALGATRDAALVEEVARITAKEVRATGANWTFAPCVTVPRDERWGRSYEGFAEDTTLVRELGAAAVRGFQGKDLADPLRVAACAKHYVGDGGTAWGTGRRDDRNPDKGGRLDQGDVRADEATPAPHPPRALRRRDRGGRRHDHALLLELERREVLGQPAAADGDPEGRARLPGLPDLGLRRDRPAAGRLPERREAVDRRGHGHGDGAAEVPGVHRHAQEPGRGGRGPPGSHRRRGAPDPAREVRDGPEAGRPGRFGRSASGELRLARAPRGGAARGARVAGPAEERQARAAALEDLEAHPRGGPRSRRHADAGRGLDGLLAGAAGAGQARSPRSRARRSWRGSRRPCRRPRA